MSTYDDQLVYAYPYSPTYPPVFNDIALAAPELSSPSDQAALCKRNGGTIDLVWTAVAGADFYVVQYSRSGDFDGPSLRASEVTAPTVTLTLTVGTELNYGATYYWRVMAYSSTGGASPLSKSRQFTSSCREGGGDSDDNTDICATLDASISVPNSSYCGDLIEASLNYAIPAGYTIQNVQWDVGYDGIILIDSRSLTGISFYTEACGSSDPTLVLTASITATDGLYVDTCEVSQTIFISCEDSVGNSTYIQDLNPCYATPGIPIDPYTLPDPKVPSQYALSTMVSKKVYVDPEYHYYNFYDDQYGYFVSGYEYCEGYYGTQEWPVINYIDWESAQTKPIGESLRNIYWDFDGTLAAAPSDTLLTSLVMYWEMDHWKSTYSFDDNGCSTQGVLLDYVQVDYAAETNSLGPIYSSGCLEWLQYEIPGGGYAPIINLNSTPSGYDSLGPPLRSFISTYGVFDTEVNLYTYDHAIVYGYNDCGVLSRLYTESNGYSIDPFIILGSCLKTVAGSPSVLYVDTESEGSGTITTSYDQDLYITGTNLFLSWTTSYWQYHYNHCGLLVDMYEGSYLHEYKAISLYECP